MGNCHSPGLRSLRYHVWGREQVVSIFLVEINPNKIFTLMQRTALASLASYVLGGGVIHPGAALWFHLGSCSHDHHVRIRLHTLRQNRSLVIRKRAHSLARLSACCPIKANWVIGNAHLRAMKCLLSLYSLCLLPIMLVLLEQGWVEASRLTYTISGETWHLRNNLALIDVRLGDNRLNVRVPASDTCRVMSRQM